MSSSQTSSSSPTHERSPHVYLGDSDSQGCSDEVVSCAQSLLLLYGSKESPPGHRRTFSQLQHAAASSDGPPTAEDPPLKRRPCIDLQKPHDPSTNSVLERAALEQLTKLAQIVQEEGTGCTPPFTYRLLAPCKGRILRPRHRQQPETVTVRRSVRLALRAEFAALIPDVRSRPLFR